MKILITGCAGYIVSHLEAKLILQEAQKKLRQYLENNAAGTGSFLKVIQNLTAKTQIFFLKQLFIMEKISNVQK